MAHGDMFLRVKGAKHGLINGESQDDQHKDEIDVLALVLGHAGEGVASAAARATGKATINELRIVKRVDRASTALMSALRTNELIKKAVLTVRKAGKTPLEYLKITIEDGRVIVADDRSRRRRGSTGRSSSSVTLRVQQDQRRVHAAGYGRAARGAA